MLGFGSKLRKPRMSRSGPLAGGPCPDFDSIHESAAVLHSWAHTEYHAGAKVELTKAAYLGARKAITEGPVLCEDGKHHYHPHEPALGEHKQHALPPKRADEKAKE